MLFVDKKDKILLEPVRAFQVENEPEEVNTFSGAKMASPGDYVVIFKNGDRGVLSREIFEVVYEYDHTDEELYKVYSMHQACQNYLDTICNI